MELSEFFGGPGGAQTVDGWIYVDACFQQQFITNVFWMGGRWVSLLSIDRILVS